MCTRAEKIGLLVAYAAIFAVLAVHPRDREAWALENAVPFCELLAVLAYGRWVELSRLSYRLIFLHLVIQMIGGHYTYAEVPLFNWVRDHVSWIERNHYDRLAHFAIGFCLYIPVREICRRRTPLSASRAWSAFFSLATIAATAGLWEVWEWIVAAWTHPELGAAYLGLQGDPWDAQKDILLAPLGALAAGLLFSRRHDRLIAGAPRKRYAETAL